MTLLIVAIRGLDLRRCYLVDQMILHFCPLFGPGRLQPVSFLHRRRLADSWRLLVKPALRGSWFVVKSNFVSMNVGGSYVAANRK
ncbi:hypothetical protein IV500_07105 [Paeniglutamicibacter antarcticus]|uniref:Uncharacterized protein n=1 Tax=Arthrobacter terrae TaxID=2935737 RepID=A0A931CIE2_9MICC|nr:hypothetical protein [Arthrobacter terrae]MBG0739162.1 hypothetical protein [Arthrobacter terrae]